jgi:CheY-like chemotaxis protein
MPSARPLKLLIVDDHAPLRHTIRQLFEPLQATVLEADSGEAALELATKEHPDWVILDMRMPGIGGLKTIEAMRRLEPGVRVVMVSQFADPEYAELARRAGAVDFVSKEDLPHLLKIVGPPPLQP